MENERDCEHCKHYIKTYIKGLEVYQCEKWDCEYEPERDCETCRYSNNGKAAGIEECHLCMWKSQYETKEKKYGKKTTDS